VKFLKLLEDLDKGAVAAELEAALAEVVGGVQITNKKGSIVLAITITPADKHAEVLGIEADVKAKPPKTDRKVDIFFANEMGELSRNNSKQLSIDDLKKPEGDTAANVTHLRKV
jgi:hypothetical protein